ncbi:hypothetical protein N7468_005268 [Penicillium chermesinum]|uniref:Uncharacterized protein n=1 Tax=Penicillium chermesinum TaxID=63820 RepID=A0A9W9TN21_9EURO|nr:uncharacterized protein N7468_005268 [Penicillium chermesinum]KAJ5232312.1 hypothetical protein N7468_005268 [Penicillium chermesinum]
MIRESENETAKSFPVRFSEKRLARDFRKKKSVDGKASPSRDVVGFHAPDNASCLERLNTESLVLSGHDAIISSVAPDCDVQIGSRLQLCFKLGWRPPNKHASIFSPEYLSIAQLPLCTPTARGPYTVLCPVNSTEDESPTQDFPIGNSP